MEFDRNNSVNPLRVLCVSTSYPENARDWKGIFIKNMITALARRNELQLQLWAPPGEKPETVEYVASPREEKWLADILAQGGVAHLLRQGGVAGKIVPFRLLGHLRKVYVRQAKQTDLFHVNWLQNALPLGGLKQPALITVLGNDLALLNKPLITPLLRRVIRQRSCIIAPNAEWMETPLQAYFGDIAEIRPVPFGINEGWYALERLNESGRAPRKWLTILRLTHKKIGPLFEWGKPHFQNKAENELHLFGPMQEQLSIPDWVHYHGATHPEELMQTWFPQAAGLITLSQHDEGRPQVMLEAMAAGLPVLASDLPAHSNLLRHGETGWLIKDSEDFAQGLARLSDSDFNQKTGEQARQWVRQAMGTWDDCAERYWQAYQRLMEKL